MATQPGDVRNPVATQEPATYATGVVIHEDIEVARRDRIRWGPVWAGLVVAIGTYLLLQLGLIAVGIVELGGDTTGDAVASAIVAIVAFFLGGLTTGATAMWRGFDDGILHGVVLWAVGIVALLVLSFAGSGLALGSIDTSSAFDQFRTSQTNPTPGEVAQTNDDIQDASGKAIAGLVLALVASAAGGAVGARAWPRRRSEIDLRDDARRGTPASRR